MPELFLGLSASDQKEALEVAAAKSGRPPHLLEKDIWVVWTLSALYGSPVGEQLSFKGGTSLSKAYRAIDRFSEDIDLTYDVRAMIPDLAGGSPDGIPPTKSQGKKWTENVRKRLPEWIRDTIMPVLGAALEHDGLKASFRQESKERLFLDYAPNQAGYGYVSPWVMLEFGARSTGEPTEFHDVSCDAAPHLDQLMFPSARPRVLKVERTYWEKATAGHVYCVQAELPAERFARHWHDLAALSRTERFKSMVEDRKVALAVAKHKAMFFQEKAPDGTVIDYDVAVKGGLRLVPTGKSLAALEDDYSRMLDAGLVNSGAVPFTDLMAACKTIEERSNQAA